MIDERLTWNPTITMLIPKKGYFLCNNECVQMPSWEVVHMTSWVCFDSFAFHLFDLFLLKLTFVENKISYFLKVWLKERKRIEYSFCPMFHPITKPPTSWAEWFGMGIISHVQLLPFTERRTWLTSVPYWKKQIKKQIHNKTIQN